MKSVAIHQPNFFPWLGYFNKIKCADYFVFLDDVQYQKTGGTWSNRVKLMVSGEPRWVTAPINRNYHGVRTVRQVEYLNDNPWREKMIKTIESNYHRHLFYDEVMDVIGALILNEESNVAAYNITVITNLCGKLGLDVQKLIVSSALGLKGTSNELLCSLTKAVGGDTYICGGGADGYQDDSVFESHNIRVQYQNFRQPVYTQLKCTEFAHGLSLIDAAMNLGWAGTQQLLDQS